MRTAYLVMGVGESTGCRFITKVLIACGIFGTAEHTQHFQNFMYNDDIFKKWAADKDTLVVRQSWPHGSTLPSLYDWYYRLKYYGYEKVYIIITTRDWATQSVSIIDNKHLINNKINNFFAKPVNRIKEAYKNIFSDLSKIDNGNFLDFFVLNLGDLSYNGFVNIKFLLDSINLEIPSNFDFNMIKKDIDKERYDYIKNNYSIFYNSVV
jgi:hypothetical protein